MTEAKKLRIARCALLDIEGTVADVRFVYDVMFPFVRNNLEEFLQANWSNPSVQSSLSLLAIDAGFGPDDIPWKDHHGEADKRASAQQLAGISQAVFQLMDRDSKTTGLKSLQGLVWESGFRSGRLRAEVFSDVVPALERWKKAGVDLRIYSSGSILAQKLFFSHTTGGDLTSFFSGHYDTTIGSKKEPESYSKIAEALGLSPTQIIFFTDVIGEIEAASAAHMQVVACVRPNNVPLPKDFSGTAIGSFDEIDVVASVSR